MYRKVKIFNLLQESKITKKNNFILFFIFNKAYLSYFIFFMYDLIKFILVSSENSLDLPASISCLFINSYFKYGYPKESNFKTKKLYVYSDLLNIYIMYP